VPTKVNILDIFVFMLSFAFAWMNIVTDVCCVSCHDAVRCSRKNISHVACGSAPLELCRVSRAPGSQEYLNMVLIAFH
jgi:hypothetical protein